MGIPHRRLTKWLALSLAVGTLAALAALLQAPGSAPPSGPSPGADEGGMPAGPTQGSATSTPPSPGSASAPSSSAAAPVGGHVAVRRGVRSKPRASLRASLGEARLAGQSPRGAARLVRRARGTRPSLLSLRESRLMRVAAAPLRLGDLTHRSFQLQKQGLPVFGRSGRLHERDGRTIGHTGRLTTPPFASEPAGLTEQDALERARRAAPGRGERAPPRIERGWLATDGETVPVWRVAIARGRPLGSWLVMVDARDGAILERHDLVRSVEGMGLVYPENIETTPVPAELPLRELDDSGFLRGRITQVFDVSDVEPFRPDRVFFFGPDDPRFIQTAVYRNLTEAALFAEQRGAPLFEERVLAFTGLGDADGGALNNAFYDPFFPIFGFGNGDGDITSHLGTDSDVALHEMGHHLFLQLVDPQGLSSLRRLASVNEGFADSLAAFVTHDPQIGESTIPGSPYLRTLVNSATWPDGLDLDPHVEGLIFGGLSWDLAQALGVELAADIVIAGLPFLDPESDFPPQAYRDALVAGEQAVSGGANRTTVVNLAEARGLESVDALGIAGFLDEAVPVDGALTDGDFRIYFFSEFPDSKELRVTLTGTGDANLVVGPLATIDFTDPSTYFFPDLFGSNESVTVTPNSTPSVDDDDVWFIAVEDFPDGGASTFTLTVSTDLPDPAVVIGGSFEGTIEQGGEVVLLTFAGTAGQIVRVEARALDPELDLALSVFDPVTIEFFGGDDDSGDGTDPLIQGAVLPRTQQYGIAVLSLIADVDPRVGAGDFVLDLSACDNVGLDFDADGQVDACDDDDDDDGFVDAQDTQPLDALRCQDIERDGCDDCTNSEFDPFHDGANEDGDHLCDAGDPDDDNDGCEDQVDSHPFSPSTDGDNDFVGLDCDNCPDDYNPGQLDQDEDGQGDVCDETPVPEPSAGALQSAALAALLALVARRRSHVTLVRTSPSQHR